MKNISLSPCTGCSRVPCPEECENIRCTLWRQWFCSRWEEMRSAQRQKLESTKVIPLGIPLGGHYYAPPHLVRAYRATDPCKKCTLRAMCKEKCKIRKRWEQQGGIQ